MTQIIVLGWDALDIDRITEYGLSGRFGLSEKRIETITNDELGEPHTVEVWPSIITGLPPSEHGIIATNKPSLTERMLRRGSGKSVGITQADEYDVPTLLDAPNDKAISIPNYQTHTDRVAELDARRDNVWSELLADRGNGSFDPGVDLPQMYDVLGREAGRRVGQVLGSMHAGYELVVCWFGLLDTVGHLDPATDAPLQLDWYEFAADVTETVRSRATGSATVVSLSDHGMHKGDHTEHATVASDDADMVADIDSVLDVREVLEDRLGGETDDGADIDSDRWQTAKDKLEELGYL